MTKTKTKTRRHANRGALQDLLLEACPPKDGNRSIPILAEHLGCTAQTIYNWIDNDKVPATKAQAVVALSEGKLVSLEKFLPFVFRQG